MTEEEVRKKIAASDIAAPLSCGFMPTPLYKHETLSAELGVTFYIKREDRIDDLGCGNKFRRLSYVVPYAKKQGADTLITVGSLPSNQCKAVKFFGDQCGMRTHLIFGGDTHARPDSAKGNYLLTALLGADISWFDYAPWEKMDEQIQLVVQQEKSAGHTPYVIISGAPEWPGILGSIDLGFEIASQLGDKAREPLSLVMPSGSGATCLGIAMAAELLGLPWKVYGVVIGETIQRMNGRIERVRQSFAEKTGIALPSTCANLVLWDKALGAGYDKPQEHEIAAMEHCLKKHNLILDLNYMIKAFIGLKQLREAGNIPAEQPVLLVHTGGHYGIFDAIPGLDNWLSHNREKWLSGKAS